MKTIALIACLLVAGGSCALTGAQRCPSYPESTNPTPRLHTKDLKVFAERGVATRQVAAMAQRVTRIRAHLLATFFPARTTVQVRLSLFRSAQSYRAFTRTFTPLRIHAHYARRTRTIYMSATAAESVVRHELMHALVEARFPWSPYWFQEGAALLVEHRARTEAGQTLRRMPPRLQSALKSVRRSPMLPAGTEPCASSAGEHDPGQAGYFALFLYARGAMQKMLRARTQPTLAAAGGSNPRSCRELHTAYARWIRAYRAGTWVAEPKPGPAK